MSSLYAVCGNDIFSRRFHTNQSQIIPFSLYCRTYYSVFLCEEPGFVRYRKTTYITITPIPPYSPYTTDNIFLFLQLTDRVFTLDDTSVFQNHNTVTVSYGGQAVGDDESGPSMHQLIHTILYQLLCSGIDRRNRFVQDQHRRICYRCTGDGQKLSLPWLRFAPLFVSFV